MREHTTTAERILDALARVPSRPHDQARALSLVRSYRNTARLAAAGRTDGEAREVVEDYRRVLLDLLVEITTPADKSPPPVVRCDLAGCPGCGMSAVVTRKGGAL